SGNQAPDQVHTLRTRVQIALLQPFTSPSARQSGTGTRVQMILARSSWSQVGPAQLAHDSAQPRQAGVAALPTVSTNSFPSSHLGEGGRLLTGEAWFETRGGSHIMRRSSSGPGPRPLELGTRVRIPHGAPCARSK